MFIGLATAISRAQLNLRRSMARAKPPFCCECQQVRARMWFYVRLCMRVCTCMFVCEFGRGCVCVCACVRLRVRTCVCLCVRVCALSCASARAFGIWLPAPHIPLAAFNATLSCGVTELADAILHKEAIWEAPASRCRLPARCLRPICC